MCGIAGILRRRGIDAADPLRLQAMTDALVHRGPDDHGYLLLDSRDGRCALGQDVGFEGRCDVLLGNRRLSIVDLSPAARQPMANEQRDLFLVFNGEIYNHVELRRELMAAGHRFASSSDTEVVLHAYDAWGPSCVRRFNGMWALAIWDQRRRRLFCSRDRFGVKPFYYFLDDDVFVFASEIKAILRAVDGLAVPNHGVVRAFLAPGALCHGEETFFARVQRLPAAQNLLVSAGGVERARYWDYTDASHAYDYARPEETFAELLDDAVRLRLRSDVPVGIALSGGVDSTAVTALARRHVGDATLKVFTAEFPGTPFDERRYAELVARRFGAEFHPSEYRPIRLVDDLERVVWHMDYPALTSQVMARWQLMALAARHVKVVLEGQGSDEMLAGYTYKYFAPWVRDEIESVTPRGLAPTIRRLARGSLQTYRRHGHGPFRNLAAKAFPFIDRSPRRAKIKYGVIAADFAAHVTRSDGTPLERPFPDRLTNILYRDHARDVLPHLLKFGDAISMGHSLESRLPFMDYRLVEFVFGLPPRQKFDGCESKVVLKRALRGVLPPEIVARTQKVGFATPVGEWLRACMDDQVRPLLLSQAARSRGIFDVAHLDAALTRLARGDDGIGEMVFRWLSLEVWFRRFIDGATAPAT